MTARSTSANDLMPPHIAAQIGLEEAWIRHVFVPAGAQSIVHQQIVVHTADPREYVEIVAGAKEEMKSVEEMAADAASGTEKPAKPETPDAARVISRIALDSLGYSDLDAARVEAMRLANNEIRRLKRRGIAASTRPNIVPRVNLYTLANDGTIDCRDAETGQPIWRTTVGEPRLDYGKMGIDDTFLTCVNGGNLIRVDVTTGEAFDSVRTTNVPLYGSIHAGDFALIPTIRNGVDGYPLSDTSKYPFTRTVDGLALSPPSKAPGTTRVAWGTNLGYVYFMELQGKPSLLFRLDTDGIVSSSVAAINGDRFFFGSENGQVYGVRATRVGQVLWSRPYADPFYNSPFVYGDQVFLRSTYGNLFALNIDDGFMAWPDTVPNVDELLGVFGGKLYVRLLSGHFSVIDTESGKTDRTFFELVPGEFIANAQTDRLYLISENGTVQCLRPQGAELPSFNELMLPIPGEEIETEKAPSGASGSPGITGDTMAPAGDDPFAAPSGGDPFAAPGGGDDPFAAPGGGDDPFAAPAGGAAMDDPFAGDDPFSN